MFEEMGTVCIRMRMTTCSRLSDCRDRIQGAGSRHRDALTKMQSTYLSIVVLAVGMAGGVDVEAGEEAQCGCQQAGVVVEQNLQQCDQHSTLEL